MKLNEEELSQIQSLNREYNKSKHDIGEMELQKQVIFKKLEAIRLNFEALEKTLMTKYGEDSVVNVQTGEITKKEQNE